MKTPELHRLECMDIAAPLGGVFHGGSQMWYRESWGRKAGCGPTNASNIIWYYARTREHLAHLCDVGKADKASFLALMDRMFAYVTPGARGIETTALFAERILRYTDSMDAGLGAVTLNIPEVIVARPSESEVAAFLTEALDADLPVAFLNLCSGKTRRLDRWHWVTLVALDPDTMTATILDQGKRFPINLGLWLRTTTLGGGFVVLQDRASGPFAEQD